MIARIAVQTPHIHHWVPTREYRIVREYLARGGVMPSNLNVRLSAHMVDETIPEASTPACCTTSAVYTDRTNAPGYPCPARNQGNECRDCRACWSRAVTLVVYPKH